MPKPKRPKLHGEHLAFDRDDWRENVTSENTHLGYWEWVLHQLDSSRPPAGNNLRELPVEVARVINPFDLWGMPHVIGKMPEVARFVQVLQAFIDCRLEHEQWELIAQHMCVEMKVLDEILDLVEKRSKEITQSIEDHNA